MLTILTKQQTAEVAMPHVTMEYSANLESQVDMTEVCKLVHATGLETGLFELGAVRVRALRADHYAVADLLPENSFIDVSIRIGLGRSDEDKKRLGQAISDAMIEFLAPQLAEPHFALSIEVREINSPLSWKTNAIHPRIRNAQ
jgi:5-carboxymethyl-2-hydroxymuconate isomerase